MGNVTKSGSSSTIRKPVDTKPILKDDLVAAYLERHRDSDYGFQAEFEQLPTGFPDRTTEICDRPANRPKNRYPDIKCYDQTRVRLKLPNRYVSLIRFLEFLIFAQFSIFSNSICLISFQFFKQ